MQRLSLFIIPHAWVGTFVQKQRHHLRNKHIGSKWVYSWTDVENWTLFCRIRDLCVSTVGCVVQSCSSVMICYIHAAHQRQQSFSGPHRSVRGGHVQRRLTAEPTPGLHLWPLSQQQPHCPLNRMKRVTCRKKERVQDKKRLIKKFKCSHVVPGSCSPMQWSQTRLVLSVNMSTWNKRRTLLAGTPLPGSTWVLFYWGTYQLPKKRALVRASLLKCSLSSILLLYIQFLHHPLYKEHLDTCTNQIITWL